MILGAQITYKINGNLFKGTIIDKIIAAGHSSSWTEYMVLRVNETNNTQPDQIRPDQIISVDKIVNSLTI